MTKHVITIIFLLCAVLFYYIGASIAATGLVILAVGFELVFWFRLFGIGVRSNSDKQDS